MPNDLYVWEDAGALVHHCVHCQKPLSSPEARVRCLGKHIECCKRYHSQLFKKGTSNQCAPCKHSEEEQHKRHREIAEVLLELKRSKAIDQPQPPGSSLTPKIIIIVGSHPALAGDSPLSKKERKALKKSKKASNLPKRVTTADIEFVTRVLLPQGSEGYEADLARQLLEDQDIKINRSFHPGTSNRREIRSELIKKDKHAAKSVQIDPEELEGILQLLNISPLTPSSSSQEKALHIKLKTCIERDLVQAANEMEATMMRKAGFWRWASKKAYKRLVQDGGILAQKYTTPAVLKTNTSTTSSACGGAVDGETDEITEPDTEVTTPSEEDEGGVQGDIGSLKLGDDDSARRIEGGKHVQNNEKGDDTDGWTMIGQAIKTKTTKPLGKVTLSHNSGLAKIASPAVAVPRYRRLAGDFGGFYQD